METEETMKRKEENHSRQLGRIRWGGQKLLINHEGELRDLFAGVGERRRHGRM